MERLSRSVFQMFRGMPGEGERMKEPITTIQVSRENRDRLAEHGKAGESLNDALTKILENADIVWASEPVPPEKWAGCKKFIDIGDNRVFLWADGSISILE